MPETLIEIETDEGPDRLAPEAGEVKHRVTVYEPEEGVLEAQVLLTVLSGTGMEVGSMGKGDAFWAEATGE